MPKGYSLDAIANVLYPSVKGVLNVNLNTLYGLDNEGKYFQSANAGATTANNYPIASAGVLEVLCSNANFAGSTIQRYTTYIGSRTFVRSQNSANPADWSDWEELQRVSLLYKQIYPVGIELHFATSVNPNSLFPGTTWTQITDGRVIRGAVTNSTGGNTANGDIGTIGGNESMTLGTNHLPGHTHEVPVHSHTIAHTHGIAAHTHTVPQHSHTMAHTHSTPNHTHSGTANSAGEHTHPIMGSDANNLGGGDSWVDGHLRKSVYQSTEAAGAHSHTVTIPSSGGGTTGGSSAGSTGTQVAVNVSSQTLSTGGSSAANSGGSAAGMQTGQGPVTNNSFNLTNPFRRVAIWRRTA